MNTPEPPIARRIPRVETLHGEPRSDDYHWLRAKDDPNVVAYLNAENAYADAMMKHTEDLQERLYQEMLGRIQEDDITAPYRRAGYLWYSRTEKGKQYPIYCRKKESLDAPEEVTLDLNELGATQKFVDLGVYAVSDDGNFLAYTLDTTGFRVYTLFVKDLRTGELGPERILSVDRVAWAAGSGTIFYVTENDAKRAYRLFRHERGTTGEDALVYEETDELFTLDVGRSRSGAFLFVASQSHTASEIRFLPAERPQSDLAMIAPRAKEHEYEVDHRGDRFYIRTNDGGRRNFRLVTAPVSDPRPENWKEIVAEREDVMIEGIDAFRDHFVLYEREDGLPHLRIIEAASGAQHRVAFPETVYAMTPIHNFEFEAQTYRFTYQSFTTSPSVFDYDIPTRQRRLIKQDEVLGGYDPAHYQAERLHATTADGARVPISIVYRKGTQRNGKSPLLLYGYGSYGYSLPDSFSSNRLSLLDRGVVFAVAHVRGGGEMGKKWHDQGKMTSKMNTFTDFIAAAEHLIDEGFTSRDHLIIEGGSAGGLLVGAAVNLRPDLFKAAVALVPFVDVINTMLDTSLPLTVGEFEEWGNPRIREHYSCMRAYSPYDNIEAKGYPAILVKTSYNDSQVMYWEPAKYVARLRATKRDDNPLLFKINMEPAGHGGQSGRYDRLRETGFEYAFILDQFRL